MHQRALHLPGPWEVIKDDSWLSEVLQHSQSHMATRGCCGIRGSICGSGMQSGNPHLMVKDSSRTELPNLLTLLFLFMCFVFASDLQ